MVATRAQALEIAGKCVCSLPVRAYKMLSWMGYCCGGALCGVGRFGRMGLTGWVAMGCGPAKTR